MPGRYISERAHRSLVRLEERPVTAPTPAKERLRAWLLANAVTVNQLALMTCMNRKILDSLLRGEHRSKSGYLQLHQAFAIEYATRGAVPAYLWLEDPYVEARIRASNFAHAKDFEVRVKQHVLKYSSLTKPDGMLREKARVLSRLFGVQWGEVKRRIWLEAEKKASLERADISHLLAPEDDVGPDQNGIYHTNRYPEMTDEEWFVKILEDAEEAGHRHSGSAASAAQGGSIADLPDRPT